MTDKNTQKLQVFLPVLTYRQVKANAILAGVDLSTYCTKIFVAALAPDGPPKAT